MFKKCNESCFKVKDTHSNLNGDGKFLIVGGNELSINTRSERSCVQGTASTAEAAVG